MQLVLMSIEYSPCGHRVHNEGSCIPEAVDFVPLGQRRHVDAETAARSGEYVPAGHCVHSSLEAVLSLYDPGSHSKQ